jgi:uncharacterized membrane protein YbhN (UPF0104 family)
MNKKLRLGLETILIIATFIIFYLYISKHTYLFTQITKIHPLTFIVIFILDIIWFLILGLVFWASIRICKITISKKENILLNAYASLTNFFLPGQGGPAIRGAYLYKKYKLKIRLYVLVTILYYYFYGIISVNLMFIHYIYLVLPVSIIISLILFLIFNKYLHKIKINKDDLNLGLKNFSILFISTCLQILITIAIYFLELHSVNSRISISQAVIYSGVANLALFVSLTPGAIGIRESFLLLSNKLHHISGNNVISASIIDRSIYLVLLLVLLIAVLIFHGKSKFGANKKQLANQ